MNNCCFSILIRQRACQNGVPVTTDRIITNISDMENISLIFGYIVSLSMFGSNDILATFTNVGLGITLRFSISNPGIGVFDLPIDGGTFRVVIISKQTPCNTSCPCSNIGWQ